MRMHWKGLWAIAVVAATMGATSRAPALDVRVTIENLSGSTGFAFSPLVVAGHNGSVDLFDNGSAASAGVEGVAELGDASTLLSEIAAMQASSVAGVVANADSSMGPLLPGATQSVVLSLDPVSNRYFSYLSMVVPSNDLFIGNDNPTARELFDAGGNFVGQDFTLIGSQIWDAGTEVNGLTGSLFIQGQDGMLSPAEGGDVHPADLSTAFSFYLGETTGPGYVFSGGPGVDSPIATISFAVIPEPASLALIGLGVVGVMGLGRSQRAPR